MLGFILMPTIVYIEKIVFFEEILSKKNASIPMLDTEGSMGRL
jgi:hypothetical protein